MMKKVNSFVRQYQVTLAFAAICVLAYLFAGQSFSYVLSEVTSRFCRNIILVLALLIPVTAGLGLNFSIVVGAIAAQVAFILVTHWHIGGAAGILLVFVISTPLAILFGWLVGMLFNKTKGQEMITGMIVGFFANGIYQLVFLVMVGTLIPFVDENLMILGGIGIRDTVTLDPSLQKVIDKILQVKFHEALLILAAVLLIVAVIRVVQTVLAAKKSGTRPHWSGCLMLTLAPIAVGALYLLFRFVPTLNFASKFTNVPVVTLVIAALIAAMCTFLLKTKLGQDFRAVGQDRAVSEAAGINVNQKRIIANILSTVIAAWGQILYVQNMTSFQTYSAHEKVGTYAVAAILIGGASIKRATISQAVIGTILFHTLFVLAPQAGNNLFGDPTYGEYFRVFVAYAVIVIALVMHAMREAEERCLEAYAINH